MTSFAGLFPDYSLEQIERVKEQPRFNQQFSCFSSWFSSLSDAEQLACTHALTKSMNKSQQIFLMDNLKTMVDSEEEYQLLGMKPVGTKKLLSERRPQDIWLNPINEEKRPKSVMLPIGSSAGLEPSLFGASYSPVIRSRALSASSTFSPSFYSHNTLGFITPPSGPTTPPKRHEVEEEPKKEKGKIPEVIDLAALEDIPTWLRSLRLHKYTSLFEHDHWREMIKLTDDDLQKRGVAALGARRKLLKVFDSIKQQISI